MRGAGAYLRSLDPQLPRDVWLLQIGGVANSFGNGVVFPFLAIYLDDVRGFGIATAGIVIQALGFGLLPLVREPWHAYVLLIVEGIGSACFWPSQSTLISRLTPAA